MAAPEVSAAAHTGSVVKSWSIGVIGLAGLATIIASVYRTPDVLLAVGAARRAGRGRRLAALPWIPAKKTLAAVIGLPGVGSAVAAATVSAPGYLNWTPGFFASASPPSSSCS